MRVIRDQRDISPPKFDQDDGGAENPQTSQTAPLETFSTRSPAPASHRVRPPIRCVRPAAMNTVRTACPSDPSRSAGTRQRFGRRCKDVSTTVSWFHRTSTLLGCANDFCPRIMQARVYGYFCGIRLSRLGGRKKDRPRLSSPWATASSALLVDSYPCSCCL
jgi:hypothetical protein